MPEWHRRHENELRMLIETNARIDDQRMGFSRLGDLANAHLGMFALRPRTSLAPSAQLAPTAHRKAVRNVLHPGAP